MPEEEFAKPEPPVAGGGIFQGLKNLYYSLEDKYYGVLDKINEKIPIYKIIDPIDEVVPSFLLLIILLILLLLGSLVLLFFLFFVLPGAKAGFLVVDEEMNFIPNVEVTVGYDGKLETITADAFGEFEITVRDRNVLVEVDKEGFKQYSKLFEVKIDETNYIILEEAVPESRTIQFRIQNQQAEVIEEAIDLEFSCTGSPKPNDRHIDAGANAGEFDLEVFLSCRTLTTYVKNVAGYKDKRVTRDVATTSTIRIILEAEPIYGQLSVLVRDAVSGDEIEEAGLKVYRVHSPNDILDKQGSTDATGTKLFRDIPAGTYYVRAEKEGYETETSNETDVVVDQKTDIEIELNPLDGIAKKILLKFVDKDTTTSIQGVTVTLFENDSELTETDTLSDGIAEFRNLSEGSEYSIVASHSDYVTKVVEDLPLIEVTDDSETIVEMEKATTSNSGTVEVEVKNYVGNTVSGASVYLYNTNYDFFVGKGSTNGDGLRIFANMPPGSYYAYATKADADGNSSVEELTAGETLRLNVVLTFGEGGLLVKVFDSAGEKIEGAKAEFYDSVTDEKLAEETTDADGKTPAVSFKINKSPYIVVKKAGYFPTITPEQEIQLRKTRTVEVILERDDAFDEFGIELVNVLKENGRIADRLDDDKIFLFEFRLKIPDNNFSDVASVIRAGLQENLEAEDSVIVIKDVQKSIASVNFSGCYDEADDYADCNVTDGDAKQIILDYGDLNRGVYQFIVETYIKEVDDDREPSTYIEMRYGAKGEKEGEEIVKGLYVWRNAIGPIVPEIFFDITLEDPRQELYSEIVSVGEEPVLILSERDYTLHYKIHNQTEEEFDNVNLTIINNNDALSLTSPDQLTIGQFEPGLMVDGSVGFSTPIPSDLTKLTFALNIDRPDNNTTVQFIVSALVGLEIKLIPPELMPGQINNVIAVVKDIASGDRMSGATINVYLEEPDRNVHLPTMTSRDDGKTNNNGQYTLIFPSEEPFVAYWVTAEKVGYIIGRKKIIVGQGPTLISNVLECVEIDNNKLYVSRDDLTKFEITNNDCGESVEILLTSCVEGTAYCNAGASDIQITSSKEFVLANGKTETVNIDTAEYLGVHPVFVQARLAGDVLWNLTDIVHIFITPDSAGYLNCLEIEEDKYIYDVFHREESGTIINKCYTGRDDEKYININLNDGGDIFLSYVIASISESGEIKYVDFNILNMGVHGEKYILMTIEDYVKGGG